MYLIKSKSNKITDTAIAAIDKTKSILRGEESNAEEMLRLSHVLKKERAFNYARKILEIARKLPTLSKSLSVKLDQQYALCTYKDLDEPVIKRLDLALSILKEERLDLDNTTDQETLGLAGAIYKRKWEANGQQLNLERALYYYSKGYGQAYATDYGYTGINAAYIHDLLAWQEDHDALTDQQTRDTATIHRAQAEIIRRNITGILPSLLQEPGNEWLKNTWWYLVTIAEAYFGLRDYYNAQLWIEKAMLVTDVPEWEKESSTKQLAQLAMVQEASEVRSQGSPAWQVLMALTGNNATALQTILSGKAGLALSGGGFRASLYHIGVLARLAEIDMLRHIEVLSCVSGGSIIGAHYYLEVRHLLQTTKDEDISREHYINIVEKISNDFLDGVQRNIRTRVIADWLSNMKMFLNKKYSRTMRAGELFEKELFSKVRDGEENKERWLHDLFIYPLDNNGNPQLDFKPKYDNWRRKAKVPVLILNATTLNTGHNWQFTASWMGESPGAIQPIDSNYRLRRMYFKGDGQNVPKERQIRLGYAVAASSCVPGMFEPLSLYDLYEDKIVRLIDGGVHDNQGICGLLEQDCTVLLLSDASGQMNSEDEPKTNILSVPMRANDILMQKVRNEQFSDMESRFQAGLLKGRMFIHLKLDLDVMKVDWINCEDPSSQALDGSYKKPLTYYGIRKEVQQKIAAIRTDLDSFNDTEAAALMTSGYLMLSATFNKTISNFPVSNEKASDWWFLSVAENLKKEEAPKKFIALLNVAKEQVFKAWRLSKSLKRLAIALLIIFSTALVYSIIHWRNMIVIGEKTTITIGEIGWTLLFFIAGIILGNTVIKWIRFRDTATRYFTGIGMITLAWIISNVHLLIFDKLYLNFGKLNRNKKQPGS